MKRRAAAPAAVPAPEAPSPLLLASIYDKYSRSIYLNHLYQALFYND